VRDVVALLLDVAAERVYVAGVVALRYELLLVALRDDTALRDDAMALELDRVGVVYREDAYPVLRRFTGPVTTVRVG